MKIPGPDHPIIISPHPARVRVRFGGQVIADSVRALALKEGSYPVVFYIPREDANMKLLTPSQHVTFCPYKGDASYFDIKGSGYHSKNAVWSYERPYPAVAGIAGYLAFYPDRVDSIEEVMT